jgi:hypothetical protein
MNFPYSSLFKKHKIFFFFHFFLIFFITFFTIYVSLIDSAGGAIRRSAVFNSSTVIDADDVVQPVTFRGGHKLYSERIDF